MAGKATEVHYRLTKKIRNKVRRKGKLRAGVTLRFTDETGDAATQGVTVTIKR